MPKRYDFESDWPGGSGGGGGAVESVSGAYVNFDDYAADVVSAIWCTRQEAWTDDLGEMTVANDRKWVVCMLRVLIMGSLVRDAAGVKMTRMITVSPWMADEIKTAFKQMGIRPLRDIIAPPLPVLNDHHEALINFDGVWIVVDRTGRKDTQPITVGPLE